MLLCLSQRAQSIWRRCVTDTAGIIVFWYMNCLGVCNFLSWAVFTVWRRLQIICREKKNRYRILLGTQPQMFYVNVFGLSSKTFAYGISVFNQPLLNHSQRHTQICTLYTNCFRTWMSRVNHTLDTAENGAAEW